MRTKKQIIPFILVCFTLGVSSMSLGDNRAQSTNPLSPELRKDMVDMYQKMADCLKTDKSLDECQRSVTKVCPVMAKTGKCPLQDGTRAMSGPAGKHPDGSMGPGSGHGHQ